MKIRHTTTNKIKNISYHKYFKVKVGVCKPWPKNQFWQTVYVIELTS